MRFQINQSKIDMHADGKYGNKKFTLVPKGDYVFMINRITGGSKIKSVLANNGPLPINVPIGVEPISYKLTGNLADINTGEIYTASTIHNGVINPLNAYIHNVISMGIMLIVLESEIPVKLPVNTCWLVTDVTETQDVSKFNQYNIDLSIMRWYGDIS